MSISKKDLIETTVVLTEAGMSSPDIKELLRLARRVQRLAEKGCSQELTSRQETMERNTEKRIVAICQQYGLPVSVSGDPRGYVVKVILPSDRYNTWGGQECGWGIPA